MSRATAHFGVAAGLLVGPFYLGLIIVLGALEPGFSHRTSLMSLLGGVPGPRGLIFNLGVATTGALVIAFAAGLRRHLPLRTAGKIGLGLLTVGGLGLVGAGAFPCDEGCSNVLAEPDLVGRLHVAVSLLAGMGTAVAPFFVWAVIRRLEEWKGLATPTLLAGVLANLPGVLLWTTIFTGLRLYAVEGLLQRMGLIVVLIWIFLVAARLRRSPMHHPGSSLSRVIVGVLLQVLCVAPAAAQEASSAAVRGPLGYGFVQGGIIGLNLDDLNASLRAAGLPGLDESVPIWGGGGYGKVGRFYFGVEGHGGLDPAAVTGSRRISLKGGYGLARAKYRALTIGGLSLYHAAGLGAGAMSLQIAELSAPAFGDVLGEPARSSTLSTGLSLLLNVGLALDYQVQVQELADGGGWGLVLGVEAGYMSAPTATSWELDGINDVAGGPGLEIQGPYLWFSLGGWGREGADP